MTATNRLKTAMRRLATRLVGRNPTAVVYRREPDSVPLDVMLGQKVLRLVTEYGDVQVQRTELSPLIPASELILGGALTRPQHRDQMDVTLPDGSVETYEVLPYLDEPHERHDPDRQHYLVHMKLVRVESP